MTVQFDSPVIEGSDVEMECRYTYTASKNFRVRWYRQPLEGTQVTVCEYITSTSPATNACYVGKFTPVHQNSYGNGHTIKLLNAGEEDAREYWCAFHTIPGPTFESSKLQLGVQGKWFRGCRGWL